jgi:oligoendopeptidase F
MVKSKTPPNWNLKDFYSSPQDLQIEKDKKEIQILTSKFAKTYKTKINSEKLTPSFLLKSIQAYEEITEKLIKILNYASYSFSTDTKSDTIKNLYQSSQEFYTQINSQILWFELEWIALDNKYAKNLISDKTLSPYKHFLTQLRVFKPFTLSESEEQILNIKSQTSSRAFVRLYDQTESSEKFEIEIKGKIKTLNSSEIGSIMKGYPERSVREKAVKAYSATYGKNSDLYTFILNTLILDKKELDSIRKFNFPEEATFLEYEVSKKTVDSMSKTVLDNKKIVERFYSAKRKLLKLKSLHEWDRYSNIYNTRSKTYSWSEAKEIILDCFKDFSPLFHDTAKLFFENKWIDAAIKDGKRSGAYCSAGTPSTHPMILVNFSGKIEDITTLAHELGHGIHDWLAKEQTLFEYHPSTAIAEMASTFAESIVFEKLYNKTTNKKEKINLLGNKIQNNFATVFRQNDFFVFESKIHNLRREKGELTSENISNIYQDILQATFGKGLTLTDLHKNFWMPILHFYHYNFYVFTYVFGELLSISLFAEYKLNGQIFINKYQEALSKGGSLTPYEITKVMDINIEDKNFWQNGLNLIQQEVDEFEKLVTSSPRHDKI